MTCMYIISARGKTECNPENANICKCGLMSLYFYMAATSNALTVYTTLQQLTWQSSQSFLCFWMAASAVSNVCSRDFLSVDKALTCFFREVNLACRIHKYKITSSSYKRFLRWQQWRCRDGISLKEVQKQGYASLHSTYPYIALCHSAAAMEPTCKSATLQVYSDTHWHRKSEDWKATVSVSINASTRGTSR